MKGISLVKLNRTYAIRLSTDLGRVKTILTLATIPFYIVPLNKCNRFVVLYPSFTLRTGYVDFQMITAIVS